MEPVRLERKFLLGYTDLYDEDINPVEGLVNVPQRASIEFISYILHLYNVRKKNDNDFHAKHLMQWVMQMRNEDKVIAGNLLNPKAN